MYVAQALNRLDRLIELMTLGSLLHSVPFLDMLVEKVESRFPDVGILGDFKVFSKTLPETLMLLVSTDPQLSLAAAIALKAP